MQHGEQVLLHFPGLETTGKTTNIADTVRR